MVTSFLAPKTDVEIHIKEVCLLPGTTVPVEVQVCPQKQLDVHEVRLELVGTEIYYVTRVEGRQPCKASIAKEFTRVPYSLKDQPSFLPGVMSSLKFNIQVPVDAPPSCRGKKVNVDWILQAILDMPRHGKLVKEVPVQVMSTPVSDGKAVTDFSAQKNYKDCTLSLEAPTTIVSKGAVSGRLQVKALKEFQVRGIRVELRQIEDASCGVTVDDVVSHQELSGPISFNDTESPSFAFSLPLPPDAPPTTKTLHSSLRWQVRAILDRRMHTDFHVDHDVFIYNAAEPLR